MARHLRPMRDVEGVEDDEEVQQARRRSGNSCRTRRSTAVTIAAPASSHPREQPRRSGRRLATAARPTSGSDSSNGKIRPCRSRPTRNIAGSASRNTMAFLPPPHPEMTGARHRPGGQAQQHERARFRRSAWPLGRRRFRRHISLEMIAHPPRRSPAGPRRGQAGEGREPSAGIQRSATHGASVSIDHHVARYRFERRFTRSDWTNIQPAAAPSGSAHKRANQVRRMHKTGELEDDGQHGGQSAASKSRRGSASRRADARRGPAPERAERARHIQAGASGADRQLHAGEMKRPLGPLMADPSGALVDDGRAETRRGLSR